MTQEREATLHKAEKYIQKGRDLFRDKVCAESCLDCGVTRLLVGSTAVCPFDGIDTVLEQFRTLDNIKVTAWGKRFEASAHRKENK